ncbi:MAG: M20/M25/M40 family metallo-hydrolase [Candidatus Thermoplasmatota archaeon]|nr:M20 family metallopeptidase [Euryarchaeota archaeon]MBU4032821.1 M20/M25/M40 family metallo-hydrolase [Candidatus Thermoplasmatota archaeon]MBU4071546.1 M20/M25/M40 family metallo-hydrolase [Candidatus Thermoplasmatota archaeon]MBU4144494.1 M20/M25/M40 family metallo-hydrolase [Candidatus Thermoplasmatota archaeon]MBU4592712.1 M20/M25/M40 family metallo-hydrolase [Candidatus Thermoplasmatota archaeon]
MFDRQRAIDLLVRLVKAESEPDMSKEPVLQVVIPLLEGMGMTVHRHENDGNPAIFATIGNPRILFNGHLDTVPKGPGWKFEFGQVEGDRVYGRGSLDMKGGCTSLLLAAGELAKRNIDFAIIFTTDEEVGMSGAKIVAQEHPELSEIPMFIICEPTGLAPVIHEKGIVQFRMTTYGKNAHSAMPELGKNAIVDLMARLNELTESELFGLNQHDPVTIGINMVSGGTGMNVIPESASAVVDVRFPADYSCAEMFGILKKLIRADDDTVEVELIHDLPPARSGISPELLAKVEELVGGKAYSVPYGTEMAVFGTLNSNIMVLGPGGSTMAHQRDEWVDITDVVRAAEVYVALAGWF